MSATLVLSCSFSRRSASRMASVLGPALAPVTLVLRRVLNSARSSATTDVGAPLLPVPSPPFVPFWAAASFKAEISRFNRFTCASDSASSTFSSSIFSSLSCRRTWADVPVRYKRSGLGAVDHCDAYLLELARQNVYDFLLLSLVGVDQVLFAFT